MFKHITTRKPESFVSPEYQSQLDNLAENLARGVGAAAIAPEVADDFDRVFIGNQLRGNQSDHLFDADL